MTTIADLTTEQKLLLYGCFVSATRYGGKYEGGRWMAFTNDTANQYIFSLTPDMVRIGGNPVGGEQECRFWWEHHSHMVGIADTPDAAVLDLVEKLS